MKWGMPHAPTFGMNDCGERLLGCVHPVAMATSSTEAAAAGAAALLSATTSVV